MNDAPSHESRSRTELIEEARRAGVDRPERMTKAELRDEILRLTRPAAEQAEARGFFGVARSMLASVVEGGLNLPDAARLIRGSEAFDSKVRHVAPVATVTLAEIYAAQGHGKRALRMLDEVLEQEPDHDVAVKLRSRLVEPEPVEKNEEPPASLGPNYVETTGEEIATGKPPRVGGEPQANGSVAVSPLEASANSGGVAGAETASTKETISAPEPPSTTEPRLLVERHGGAIRLYWELSPGDIERAGFGVSEAHPAIRVVAFEAQLGAPERREKTLHLPSGKTSGSVELSEFSAQTSVRAAVGLEQEGAFVPLAVGRSREELGREAPDFVARADS